MKMMYNTVINLIEIKLKEVMDMAFYDWNHDGKKDFTDDFIEYQNYKQSTNNSNNTSHGGGGISTIGAIVATIGGLFLAAAIVALFGGGEKTPVLIIIILWAVCSAGISVWFDNVGF